MALRAANFYILLLALFSLTTPSNAQDNTAGLTIQALINGTSTSNWPTQKDYDTYFDKCLKELGKAPTFRCADGRIVPVQENFSTVGCERPALLHGSCEKNNRLGTLPAEKGRKTLWVFSCRRSTSYGRFLGEDEFNDINMIGYNPDNGATCFFQANGNHNIWDRFPSTDSPQGRSFWAHIHQNNTRITCMDCHSNDPFIHTPFVRQVMDKQNPNMPLLPSVIDGPYRPIPLFRNEDYYSQKKNFHLADPQISSCTDCHRIDKRICSGPEKYQSFERAGVRDLTFMPPKGQIWEHGDLGTHSSQYSDMYQHIRNCCASPSSCNWSEIPGTEDFKGHF